MLLGNEQNTTYIGYHQQLSEIMKNKQDISEIISADLG